MANAIAGLSSLALGKIYDRKGAITLILATILSAPFVFFVFLESPLLALFGMILFGIGTASQSSLLRAVAAHLVPPGKRGSAYGLLNLTLGIGGAVGSFIMGSLYDISRGSLIVFSILSQLIAVLLFLRLIRQHVR